ncbi:MAG: SRPBCC domain-containing protein [Bacteroidota bacterium]|nr:SRPBCC domain-containing protein [Bacteroidota bacterium]MDP4229058.1 SRPBCC domain-containing protein [Bacteroidota bacterium]MDP4235420.1 SRPBCC domain-containing protein [Bacteroidota bacterium]
MKAIYKEATVHAPIDAVWNAWTTSEGITSFFAPQAFIDLRIGGAYEVYFMLDNPRGLQGSEGCTIISYLPKKMLSFTWNCPPEFERVRKSGEKNWVVLLFHELPEGNIRVEFNQIGWKENDEEWDKIYSYFDKAWGSVMESFADHFQNT